MKSYPAPPIPAGTIAKMQGLVNAGATPPELIAAMRGAGLSVIPSIKLLEHFYGLPSNEAKAAVHYSEMWANARIHNERIHEDALTAAKNLGFEEAHNALREEVAG